MHSCSGVARIEVALRDRFLMTIPIKFCNIRDESLPVGGLEKGAELLHITERVQSLHSPVTVSKFRPHRNPNPAWSSKPPSMQPARVSNDQSFLTLRQGQDRSLSKSE
mmetsp:Transcript_65/g.107  ORF Transcript_65/g.107 Transcript_65/m.107 type:complete len:108 (-) Transcript_65:3598-3921(-)